MRERLRKLHLDGREFAWKAEIRAAPGADGRRHRYIRVRVWGAGKNSCVLQADMTELPVPATSEETTYAYPSAAIVRRLVSWGLEAGWAPEQVGGVFRVSSAVGPALPGLGLVDLP
ncbi:integrase [Actinoplanes sp. NPDC004185]